jgi:hypothetical protein
LLISELRKAGDSISTDNLKDEEIKKMGEDVILQKLNNIFDELQID